MHEIDLSADDLIAALLGLSEAGKVCVLDSCGVGHLGSHLLIAGLQPVESFEFSSDEPEDTLRLLDEKLSSNDLAAIFTISYDFGLKLQKVKTSGLGTAAEPDIFISLFDCLVVHDYDTGKTFLTGNSSRFAEVEELLTVGRPPNEFEPIQPAKITSNFSKTEYITAIETIKEHIRRGDTYQTNLTQQLLAELPKGLMPEQIFLRLRKDHPAPFAAFLKRNDSTVISASPERFLRVEGLDISVSPIKGTRSRGKTPAEDAALRAELLSSEKDRAENTMIVDLMRNDIGRICEFGSVEVEKLCDLEEHPTLFHLVSTVRGKLRAEMAFSDILQAVFPCGSITGAPKIRTMEIIDEFETVERGLSMGAIGCYVPGSKFQVSSQKHRNSNQYSWDLGLGTWDSLLDMSVAIRTMVVRGNDAIFNVGGGIVIDSDPESEYEETLLKAKALLRAIGSSSEFQL